MRGSTTERLEAVVDRAAAAVFAGAVGFCVFSLAGLERAQSAALAAAAAAVAYLLCARVLQRLGPGDARFEIPPFDVEEIAAETLDELILTDADRLPAVNVTAGDELILDDVLADVEPDARVVRLFDVAAMPTPGQLNARIEQHLSEGSSPAAPPDASHALYEALTELRRSLR